MFKITREKRTNLEKAIDNLLVDMEKHDADSKEYSTMVDNLEKLYKAKSHERDRHVSRDTLAVIAGNLMGILLILGYEKTDIIRTKALGFVIKGRV